MFTGSQSGHIAKTFWLKELSMSFLGNLFKKHAENAITSVQQFLVTIDPETATEAQMAEFSDQLSKASEELARARAEYQKDLKEANDIAALYDKRLQAATILEQQSSEATDPAQKASLAASLEKLVAMLEQMKPDVEREKQEAEDARLMMEDLSKFVEESAEALKQARARLEHAKTEMRRAELEKERAMKRAHATEVLAGIKKDSGTFNVALDAMQKKADADRVRADAANTRSKLLTPTNAEKDDANIAAAMTQASGSPAPSTGSLSDRLAALKK
jgi:chromosome segregation ATPase